jgi:pimeloyl-ACP methyl ester carboxylesterase/arginase family enzyme
MLDEGPILALVLVVAMTWQGANAGAGPAQEANPTPARGAVRVTVVKMRYVGERNVAELSRGPDDVVAGLTGRLEQAGARVAPVADVRLNADEDREYGAWRRLALANGRLADLVAAATRDGSLSVGVLANCSSLLGMLAGVQRSGPSGRSLRVGLLYIDAHGDFNTPETTLSGMLGGMPVAVAAGLGLTRLRVTSKLDPPLPSSSIVLAGVRDTDPLEQELIEREHVARLSVDDLRQRSAAFQRTLADLSGRVDRIYVHVDMDVLDPREVPGHGLTVAGGISSVDLGRAIEDVFQDPKAVAFGVASTPTGERDKDGVSVQAAQRLIQAAVRGVQSRSKGQAMETKTGEVTGRARSADGVEIAYATRGTGEDALVFIHGGLADRSFWAPQLAALADRYRVVVLDLAGHGQSGRTRTAWTIPAFGADVRAVVDALGLRRVVLIGNSLGGPVALEAARLLRPRALGVVGVDTLHDLSQKIGVDEARARADAFRTDFAGACRTMAAALFHPGTHPELRARAEASMLAMPQDVVVGIMEGFAGLDLAEATRAAGVPIRALNGDLWPTSTERNRTVTPDFEAVVMTGAGHYPMLERPDEFNRLLVGIVRGLVDGARKAPTPGEDK